MQENYIIAIRGRQYTNGNLQNEDCVDVLTMGNYVKKGNARYIAYKEYSEDNPSEHTMSMLKVEEDKITISKSGFSKYKMILEKGIRHKCEYSTDVGFFMLGVYTESIQNNLTDNGGSLSVSYDIDIDANLMSKNEISIVIKEAAADVNSSNNSKK